MDYKEEPVWLENMENIISPQKYVCIRKTLARPSGRWQQQQLTQQQYNIFIKDSSTIYIRAGIRTTAAVRPITLFRFLISFLILVANRQLSVGM